jgi:hypothetical protein
MNGESTNQNHLIDDVVKRLEDILQRRDADTNWPNWSGKTYQELRNGLAFLRVANIYAHRINGLLSEEDTEETFLSLLKKKLKDIGAIAQCAYVHYGVDYKEKYAGVCLNNLDEEEFDAAVQGQGPSCVLIVPESSQSESAE